eukprot:2202310-Prymnesium_polylepis.1
MKWFWVYGLGDVRTHAPSETPSLLFFELIREFSCLQGRSRCCCSPSAPHRPPPSVLARPPACT